NFNKDYLSLLSAQTNNTLWAALATASSLGNIPRASALAQEKAYIDRLPTATGEVSQPAYITGLPADQKAYMQSFNRQVASIAKVDFFGEARNATNATSLSTMGGRQGATTTAGQTSQGPSSSPSASATNTTGSKALGNPSQPTGVYKMAGAAAVGVLGVVAFL
ncbi:MAG: hypothetical protein LQ338_005731, partial [Usnochroma carphineum]